MTEWADENENYRRERVTRGWIDLKRDVGGVWRISWAPDLGEPDWPGHTFSPYDLDLPADYPGGGDPEALAAWGRERFK